MENDIQNAMWPFRIQGNAIWPHQSSNNFWTHDERHILGVSRAHPIGPIGSSQTSWSWVLCDEREMWMWLYLGLWLCSLMMDTWNVVRIQECHVPTRIHDVQSFLGITNFYCQLIKAFPLFAQPLVTLTLRKCSISLDFNCLNRFRSI